MHVGLFGSMKNAQVINLTIENYSATISSVNNKFCWGALAGYAESCTFDHVKVNGNININSPSATDYTAYVGMIAGESKGSTYTHCEASGDINVRFALTYVGGFAGITKTVLDTMENCISTVNVSAYGAGRKNGEIIAEAYAGGFIGCASRLHEKSGKCVYTGEATASVVDGALAANAGIGVFGMGHNNALTGTSRIVYKDFYFNYEKLGYALNDQYATEAALAARYAIGGSTTKQDSSTTVYAFNNAAQTQQSTFAYLDFDTEWSMGENGPTLRKKTATFTAKSAE